MTILVILLAIGLQIYLSAKKWSPFLSLLIVSVLAGLLLGLSPMQLVASIEKGVGSTLGGLALIICLGAALGKILEESGAAEQVATTLINAFGLKNIQWAVMVTGLLIGIPLYYNAGFIILVPLIFMLVRKTGLPLLYIAIPMAASLSTTHCFLPPHPGPVVLVNALGADMGKTLIWGFIIAIPAVIIAGPLLGRRLKHIVPQNTHGLFAMEPQANSQKLPPAFPCFLIALLPVLLIALGVVAKSFLPDGFVKSMLLFTGDTNIALLLSVLLALAVFGFGRKVPVEAQTQWVSKSIAGIAVILLIITAGGVFKQVLVDSGTADYISSFSKTIQFHPLLFAWCITALLRIMIGSATVAGIAAAGVVQPLLQQSHVSPELMVLAVGAGSVFGSHVNDSGFWMFKEFFNLSLKQTFMSWTVMESVISVIGLAGVLILSLFV
ncbi:MAG TPA: gluconate:H+ symporter [Phnomibacter sp.]|nr:gluconate:H+ symporter [Phnomibacter sp.]